MSTTKHTPGPWRVDLNRYDGEYRVYQVDGHPIVNSMFLGKDAGPDAALIAASPKLLELAEAFVSYLEDDSRSERRRAACLKEARALIAEAKGEK